MKCHMCGKEITENIYVYKNKVACHDCVSKECYEDLDNYIYIDSHFRDVHKFNIVYNNYLEEYKRKLKSSLIMYNKTKNPLHKMDMEYYSRRIEKMEELLK